MDPSTNPKAAKYLLCSKNVAQIALEKGFDTIDNISLAVLTDAVFNYIEDMALTIKSDTEHSGRTEANLVDALHGLLQYDVKSEDIEEFMGKKKEKTTTFHEVLENQLLGAMQGELALGLQRFPKHTPTNKPPAGMPVDHIPEFLRQFPLDITFAGEKMQDKQPTEKERAMGKFREKSSIEVGMEKIADEAHVKVETEEPRKPEVRANPFLSNIPIIKE